MILKRIENEVYTKERQKLLTFFAKKCTFKVQKIYKNLNQKPNMRAIIMHITNLK
jgi:hypothetical protein